MNLFLALPKTYYMVAQVMTMSLVKVVTMYWMVVLVMIIYMRLSVSVEGFAKVMDFNSGDKIELKGASGNYSLMNYNNNGISGIGIYAKLSTGIMQIQYNELIAVVQNVAPTLLNLDNSNQFNYV